MSKPTIQQPATEGQAEPRRASPIKENAALQTTLDSLLRETTEGELIELLADMNREGAIALCCDELNTRWWFTDAGDNYADRLFPLEDDHRAHLAELFLLGQIVFSVRTAPPRGIEWRLKVPAEVRCLRPN